MAMNAGKLKGLFGSEKWFFKKKERNEKENFKFFFEITCWKWFQSNEMKANNLGCSWMISMKEKWQINWQTGLNYENKI